MEHQIGQALFIIPARLVFSRLFGLFLAVHWHSQRNNA